MAATHRYETVTTWAGNLGTGTSGYRAYSRDHHISTPVKSAPILASSDPAFRGDRTRYNPEELLVGALSACHMLWVLHLCAEAGITVTEYVDIAEGVLTENADGSGQFTATYTNDFAVTGTDNITASASFNVPVGLEFKTGDKQGIVLAGTPRTGTVDGTATRDWISARCGDGVINLEGEECDDGNTTDGDGCDSNCTTTRCGNNVRTAGEQCDDGNQN